MLPRSERSTHATVVVIGAGPRAIGWLERFAAARSVAAERPRVVVQLIDPFPAGPGRIWRREQSPLLKLNSMAEDVTMFTDDSCSLEGPVRPGPSLLEWVEAVRDGRIVDVEVDPHVADELTRLRRGDFPTRRLHAHYLDWFLRRAIADLDDRAVVVRRTDTVVAVEPTDGHERVRLAGGDELIADALVYAIGHTGSEPDGETAELVQFAHRHGLRYQPPAFTADADLSAFGPQDVVAVRGMGLAAIDLIVLLTEGRGGRFLRRGDSLRYVPSGREPKLLIGSRRGVPYRAKISSTLTGEAPSLRYLTPEILAQLTSRGNSLDFRRDVWPVVEREILHGYYRELFTGHPERTTREWTDFLDGLDAVDPHSDDYRSLVADAIPDPGDRLLLDLFDRPLTDARFQDRDELQRWVRAHLDDDLHRRTAPEHSATLGLFTALLLAMFALAPVSASPAWTEESRVRDLHGWWPTYFSYVASGPPGHRIAELIALSEAGIIEFAGANISVEPDERQGRFLVSSTSIDGNVTVDALIDAWLPAAHADRTDNSALRDLIVSGSGSFRQGMLRVDPTDSRIIDPAGRPHPRRWAIGPFTDAPFAGAFSRPNTNALSFRENDRTAHAVMQRIEHAADRVADPQTLALKRELF
ncbi:hypothetical protein ASF88_19450 [Leifsonia sp. Leaf336]|uniref:FAD/NAD(P)-binding protein n=1 Tax=Leifsonia sp. Leaf336 TaxID=1736341 RepID=UPI0006FB6651|nr:FAD/NAD(P)-binding protein [Leifsonia sp. Leaf336]KQR51339.1 hypothetical protein ASF88_19450 [Leifsonia sp. Leaf336]